jgi:undecaprenyl phosphate-alpha-L-ara4N flippase subunit ArnE
MAYFQLILALLLNIAGQLLFKRAAMSGSAKGAHALKAHLSGWFVAGAGSLVTSMLFWVLVLRTLPLTLVYPFTGVNFIVVPLASHWLWKEPLPRMRLVGIFVILVGVALVARPGS